MKLRNGKECTLCYIYAKSIVKTKSCTKCKPGSSPQYSLKIIYCSEKFQKKTRI